MASGSSLGGEIEKHMASGRSSVWENGLVPPHSQGMGGMMWPGSLLVTQCCSHGAGIMLVITTYDTADAMRGKDV